MYPRYLQSNTQESLFIPGYSALHTFTFTTDQFEKWSDIFGEDSGLRYTICDSVMFYDLTRCIVDFTDPANIVDLSVYANEVQEKGLKFFTEELG